MKKTTVLWMIGIIFFSSYLVRCDETAKQTITKYYLSEIDTTFYDSLMCDYITIKAKNNLIILNNGDVIHYMNDSVKQYKTKDFILIYDFENKDTLNFIEL